MNTGVGGKNFPDLKEGSLSQKKYLTVTDSRLEVPVVDGADGPIVQANDDSNPKIKCSIGVCPMLHEKLDLHQADSSYLRYLHATTEHRQ